MSRILTLIKCREKDAIKITLEMKRDLVEAARTDISQSELEEALFRKISEFGYEPQQITRYKLVTKFYQMRKPFIILVCGTKCMGKSTLVTQFAEKINISNILQTSIVKQVIKSLRPKQEKTDDVIGAYVQECRAIRNGCNFDISKCFKDGKPLVIDGSHIDPHEIICRDPLSQEYRIAQPSDKDESNHAVLAMHRKMASLDQDDMTLIIPFLLTIGREEQV